MTEAELQAFYPELKAAFEAGVGAIVRHKASSCNHGTELACPVQLFGVQDTVFRQRLLCNANFMGINKALKIRKALAAPVPGKELVYLENWTLTARRCTSTEGVDYVLLSERGGAKWLSAEEEGLEEKQLAEMREAAKRVLG